VIPSDHNVMWGIGSDRFKFIYFYSALLVETMSLTVGWASLAKCFRICNATSIAPPAL
jgi:hypothetical protein